MFRGAGWNVIKVIWGSKWDELLAADVDGVLLDKMNTTVDGEFQRYAVESGAYIREHFFGPDPRLRQMVEHLTDEELRALPRGGHDYRKLYAAYKAATEQPGAPTVILAKTIKGWTLGPDVEGRNATHQIKKMTDRAAPRAAGAAVPPGPDPRGGAGRRRRAAVLPAAGGLGRAPLPDGSAPGPRRLAAQAGRAHASGRSTLPDRRGVRRARWPARASRRCPPRWRSPGCCGTCAATTSFGPRVVPIIPDEARTFGMDSLFREFRIYASQGQKYEPVDHELLLSYTESTRRPDPRGGHHRGRLDGLVHRGRHLLRHPRRADGAVLHLLLDVRLPAGRRPHLAGGRRPGPGLPAGRHRRAHHAARRGPPAPGRPQPRAGVDGAGRARPTTRPSPTRWPRSSGTGCSACTAPSPRTSSTT